MPKCFIRIIKRPDGEAPDWVRDAWIGLVLPVNSSSEGMTLRRVISKTLVHHDGSGYAVEWTDAMTVLTVHALKAREWWQGNTRGIDNFVFDRDCCEEVPD